MRKTNRNGKTAGIIASMALMTFLAAKPVAVMAEDITTDRNEIVSTADKNISTYTLDMNDKNPLDTLKREVMTKYADSASINTEETDLTGAVLTADGFDRTTPGLQTVSLTLSVPAKTENETSAVLYTETAFIELENNGPTLLLKSEEVTVDLNSTFSYTDNIGYIASGDGVLPAIKETDNVDVTNEGTYQCTVEAVDAKGNKTSASFNVTVKKPAEVIRAEEEARIAAEKAAAEAAARAAEEAARQAAQAAAAAAAPAVNANAPVNPTGSAIADYALQFVGSPYVWGGTTPAGFDCSGFTQYVFAQFGISLPRTSYGQETVGTIVSPANAMPGDLVTYNNHSAIYIGNGMVVNAMSPGQGVAVCSMYAITNGNMQIHRI